MYKCFSLRKSMYAFDKNEGDKQHYWLDLGLVLIIRF